MQIVSPNAPLTSADFSEAEAQLGFALPADLRRHYERANGGQPFPNAYLAHGRYFCVHQFFPLKHGSRLETVEEIYRLCQERPGLPKQAIPFATDASGDWYCYSIASDTLGRVFHFRSEYFTELDRAVRWLAKSLDDFLSQLVEEPNT
ncbi:MAG: SMI1/KNR4 family protein [Rhizobacter sp.]|nr:SMI1/KNR4 family protein [Rhizobacter sp.]